MEVVLDEVETRVLGSLLEKDITTPDYYPLSLNALVNACNQKSNSDPVMTLEEDQVRQALFSLNEKNLTGSVSTADSRVPKYEHRLQEAFNFTRAETAVLCVLLLRGPQTLGELRGRTERMHRFDDLSEVQSALQRLMQREPPLAAVLLRQPGTKESRYAHLLGGEVVYEKLSPISSVAGDGSGPAERIARLEEDLQALRGEFQELKQQLLEFRRQFE